MSDIIKLLPDHVANQIAAGEVVQRPASVVKELLENAVDADADSVQLIIKDAGRTLVQVIDNGKGMSMTDARMAFERHATSKITTTEDIFHIMTKGFRGEALASISAVSQTELKTKRNDDEIGTEIQNHGGKIQNQNPTISAKGTAVSVKNLFYNVPARRNFLKSNAVEFRHIMDEFHRVALAHENVDFQLIHNDEEVLRLVKSNLAQRIAHIFGRKFDGQLLPINEETELVKITGYVAKPELAKKNRGEQFFFVNYRFIRSPYLHKALQSAFEHLVKPGFHPAYFIFLEINPEKIDINIHPTKTEIKFEDDFAIYAVLRTAVKHTLGQYQVTPPLDFDQPKWEMPLEQKTKPISTPKINVNPNYNPFKTEKSEYNFDEVAVLHQETYPVENELINLSKPILEVEPAEIQVLQWNQKYIVATFEHDLLAIDQHRAHQTILFEHFMQKKDNHALSQQLLFPLEITVDEQDKSFLNETERALLQFGFDFKLDENLMIVSAIPADLSSEMVGTVLTDFLSAKEYPEEIDYMEQLAKFMAKSAAIKKGTKLSLEEVLQLARQLFALGCPKFSPFGKKIYHKIELNQITKELN